MEIVLYTSEIDSFQKDQEVVKRASVRSPQGTER